MARRRAPTLWSLPLQRSVQRFARSAMRSGSRAIADAIQLGAPPKRPRRARPASTTARGWTEGVAAFGALLRRYRLYRPPGLRRDVVAPLVVMLHGCGQDAAGFAVASRMNRVADREGFLVLYPEQDRVAHAQGCWHWYDTRLGRAQAEAASIVAAVDQVVATQAADPTRVVVAGLSAGAGMAALIASLVPERVAAVAMHSGVAPGAAHSTATALAAMQGRRGAHLAASATPLPPLLVIQGDADGIVRAANGRDAACNWAVALGAAPAPPRTVRRGARRPMQVTDFRRDGRVCVTLCEIAGLGHAWSGGAAGQSYTDPSGPDAARLIWSFAARAFGAAKG